MERDEFYLNELILALGVVIVFLFGFWYYSALLGSTALANEKIAELQSSCSEPIERKNECNVIQSTYNFEKQILCSPELKQAEENLNSRIQSSYNIIEIKELMRPDPVDDVTELGGFSLGEFQAGNAYFKEISGRKMQILQNIGGIEACIQRMDKLRSYTDCDIKNAAPFINPENQIAVSYFREARGAFNEQNFVRAIYYTTAAISYSGETARDAYADIVEGSRTQGLVC